MSSNDLYGLVLAGGKSSRMGMDKGAILYHNEPQRIYAYNLLNHFCSKTFLSIRSDQQSDIDASFNTILDQNEFRGPFNGITSAHHNFPNCAWLVLATDLPLMNEKGIEFLIKNRNTTKLATAYATRKSKLPEPLVAIWEPKGIKKAIEYLNSQQGICPRKFLINSDIEMIFPQDDEILMNANTIDEYNLAKKNLA